jgi:TonB-linked SusC/RagA family outer membrane protein
MKKLVIQTDKFKSPLYCNLKMKLTALFMIVSLFQIHANTSLTKDVEALQTQFQVSGTVLDQNGQPLPGATIIEKGTSNGTTGDFDGNFSIILSNENATIIVSYLGFIDQEIPVAGKSQIQIVLKGNLSELDEVVVVGYGRQRKETVVGSVVQAKGEQLLQAGSVATVSEALTGLMAGVSTQQAAGQPGSTAANILIRGASSFNGGNQPLYIVDGVERDFNDLDPNEIESISVLKDASATAVFGVKAANGVIVVATKRGKAGETKVTITSTWGLKEPTMNTDYYADYPTTLEKFNEAAMNDLAYDLLVPQSLIDTWRDPDRDKTFYTYTTWINNLLKTGTASQYNVNVSGGNDFVKFFTSLGYQFDGDIFDFKKQDDFDPRTNQKRFTWRSNLDFNFSKSTQFKVGISGNFKNLNLNSLTQNSNGGVAGEAGTALSRIWQTPLAGPTPILPDGRLTTLLGATINPNFYRIEREGQWVNRSNTLYTDFTLVQNLTKDLKVQGRLSYNFSQAYQSSIRQSNLFYYPTEDNIGFIQEGNPDAIQGPPSVSGESIDGSNNSLYYELRANYDKNFGHHKIGVLGLFSRRKAQNGASFPRFEESWVGRATYGYKSKYLFEFNGAYNGSENWEPGLRFGFFPSAAAGWVISREKFFKDNFGFFDFLKVRYSYGELGDAAVSQRFLYTSPYETRGTTLNLGDPITGYGSLFLEGTPGVSGNTWQVAIKQDLGIEFNILNNQLQTTVELFDEQRTQILTRRRTVAPWFGSTAPFANIGRVKNHGIDLGIKWNSKIGENIRYNLSANISMSESRVLEQDDPVSTAPHLAEAGKPVGWSQGLINDGIYRSWEDVYNSTISSFNNNLSPGSLSFVDYDGDGQITLADRVPIANPNFATKTYAFNLGFAYKNFSVNAVFNGMWDISKNLADEYLFSYRGEGASTGGWQLLNNEQFDAWSVNNPNGSSPALRTATNNHDDQISTYTNRSANFLRFKSLEFKYRLSKDILQKINLFDTFEIFVNGNNLVTWSDLPGEFDPEQRQLQVYPIVKRYNFGVKCSF